MDQIYKEIVRLQYKCNDYIDNPSASSAQSLKQEVQRLEDETQVNKNPISLENKIESIVRILELCGESGAMSHSHVSELARFFEELREDLRKLR